MLFDASVSGKLGFQWMSYICHFSAIHNPEFSDDESSTLQEVAAFQISDVRRRNSKMKIRKKQHVLQQIRHLQRTTHNLLKTAPFTRLVKEIIREVAPNKGYRIKPEAIQALMDVSYFYICFLHLFKMICF